MAPYDATPVTSNGERLSMDTNEGLDVKDWVSKSVPGLQETVVEVSVHDSCSHRDHSFKIFGRSHQFPRLPWRPRLTCKKKKRKPKKISAKRGCNMFSAAPIPVPDPEDDLPHPRLPPPSSADNEKEEDPEDEQTEAFPTIEESPAEDWTVVQEWLAVQDSPTITDTQSEDLPAIEKARTEPSVFLKSDSPFPDRPESEGQRPLSLSKRFRRWVKLIYLKINPEEPEPYMPTRWHL